MSALALAPCWAFSEARVEIERALRLNRSHPNFRDDLQDLFCFAWRTLHLFGSGPLRGDVRPLCTIERCDPPREGIWQAMKPLAFGAAQTRKRIEQVGGPRSTIENSPKRRKLHMIDRTHLGDIDGGESVVQLNTHRHRFIGRKENGGKTHILPNVKDEPRRRLARIVRQHDP